MSQTKKAVQHALTALAVVVFVPLMVAAKVAPVIAVVLVETSLIGLTLATVMNMFSPLLTVFGLHVPVIHPLLVVGVWLLVKSLRGFWNPITSGEKDDDDNVVGYALTIVGRFVQCIALIGVAKLLTLQVIVDAMASLSQWIAS